MLKDSTRKRNINAVFAQIKLITEIVVHAGNAVITGKYDAPTTYVTTIGSAIKRLTPENTVESLVWISTYTLNAILLKK